MFTQNSNEYRVAVELKRSFVLINHGPTVLVSAQHAGRSNVMAAAWNMPLDFMPPKIAVVIDKATYTRELIESSGEFVISVPTVQQVALTNAVGNNSGHDVEKSSVAQFAFSPASKVAAPLIDGCVAWLECKILPEPEIARKYDLFLAEIVAAWADRRAWVNNRWVFDAQPNMRTIHHMAGGQYLTAGEVVK
jgi:flavin reductase (DIM6/NTAB) family NADH-FMN oxidoreductase RutF